MKLKELRERRAEVFKTIGALRDKSNDDSHAWTGDEERQWTEANEDYNRLDAEIKREERFLEVDAEQRTRDDASAAERDERRAQADDDERARMDRADGNREATEEDRCIALQAWFRDQSGEDLTDTQREVVGRLGVNPGRRTLEPRLHRSRDLRRFREESREHNGRDFEFRAQSTTDAEGGYTIPEGFVNRFERALLAFGGVRQVAEIVRTDGGNDLHWPTSNDTGNTGALLGENTQVSEVDATVGELVLQAYKYTSNLIRVSAEILEDSAFDFAQIIGDMLGERIGRILNTHFTVGTGTAQPNGIVTAASSFDASTSTAIVAADFLNIVHEVDRAYRDGASWMMADATLLALRKFADSQGQYLWVPGLTAGEPDTLLGYPVIVNNDILSALTVGNDVAVFGQLSKYKIREVRGLRMKRLVERYADYDQEGFVGFMRADGDLLDAGTNPVKKLNIIA